MPPLLPHVRLYMNSVERIAATSESDHPVETGHIERPRADLHHAVADLVVTNIDAAARAFDLERRTVGQRPCAGERYAFFLPDVFCRGWHKRARIVSVQDRAHGSDGALLQPRLDGIVRDIDDRPSRPRVAKDLTVKSLQVSRVPDCRTVV